MNARDHLRPAGEGMTECFRVMGREELEQALRGKEIPCSRREWDPYPPNTKVFVFTDRRDAETYAPESGRKDPVLVTLLVASQSLEKDRSAEDVVPEAVLEEARRIGASVEGGLCRWRSSHAHEGPISAASVVGTAFLGNRS